MEVMVMKRIRDRVGGLDVHRDTVVACCRVVDPDGSVNVTKASFSTTRKGLGELAEFLSDAAVDTVAMEATGVYWINLHGGLEEAGLEVVVVNGAHCRNFPGRKTDMEDCQWIGVLHAHGLLSGGFVPPSAIRRLRDYMRLRCSPKKHGKLLIDNNLAPGSPGAFIGRL